jgi:hypothetical protein
MQLKLNELNHTALQTYIGIGVWMIGLLTCTGPTLLITALGLGIVRLTRRPQDA